MHIPWEAACRRWRQFSTDRSLQKKHRWQAASHSPWSQQDSGITLSTSMGMIGVLEITLIVPTLRVGMPLRTLRVRSRMWRRCVDKLQHYPRHALGSLNPQSVPFVTRSVTGCMPTRSDGHDQYRAMIVPHAPRGNASQDAPRPLSKVAQMHVQAPALSTSCARLTESSVCAICDAERHGMHTHAERWARSASGCLAVHPTIYSQQYWRRARAG